MHGLPTCLSDEAAADDDDVIRMNVFLMSETDFLGKSFLTLLEQLEQLEHGASLLVYHLQSLTVPLK